VAELATNPLSAVQQTQTYIDQVSTTATTLPTMSGGPFLIVERVTKAATLGK
jgi:hypothetical protein